VILSLAAVAGTTLGGRNEAPDRWARIVVSVFFSTALAALVVSLIAIVWKVLLPRPGLTIHTNDTDRWIEPEFTDLETVMVDGYLLDGYAQALHAVRDRNEGKATWLGRGFIIVCIALGCVAIAGVTATLDRYAIRGRTNPPVRTRTKPHSERSTVGGTERRERFKPVPKARDGNDLRERPLPAARSVDYR
jgi:hypothetical protein